MSFQQWYVKVASSTEGPLSTELVLEKLTNGQLPFSALVCRAGAYSWLPLSTVPPFSKSTAPSSMPAPSERGGESREVEAAYRTVLDPVGLERAVVHLARSVAAAGAAADSVSVHDHASAERREAPVSAAPVLALSADGVLGGDAMAEVRAALAEMDDDTPADAPGDYAVLRQNEGRPTPVGPWFASRQPPEGPSAPEKAGTCLDWGQKFCEYFEVDERPMLPDEALLLGSLETVSVGVLAQPEALWNLALCLSFGSDTLARVAARAVCRIVGASSDPEPLDWMVRVLLSRGFLPSGIPLQAGQRGLSVLQQVCPQDLRSQLEQMLAGPDCSDRPQMFT